MTYREGKSDIPARVHLGAGDSLLLKSGTYSVVSTAGRGGFAHVYVVENGQAEVFALKLIDLWLIRPDEYEYFECRFKQEFEAGNIASNYLVRSYFEGSIGGNPYILMDYCPNGSLDRRINEFSTPDMYHQLGIDILNGLRVLHREGIIHRDLKPENILFGKNDEVKISDFGIAGHLKKRMTTRNFLGMVSQVWGTPLYSAPEQLDHSKAYKLASPAMDIFSFGVLMYEVISGGKHPFGNQDELSKDSKKYINRVLAREFRPIQEIVPTVNRRWAKIIERCIEPKPQKRYSSVDEIFTYLEASHTDEIGFAHSGPKTNGQAILKIIQGEEIGRIYNLDELSKRLGDHLLRIGWLDPEGTIKNDIAIQEHRTSYISRYHATILKNGNGWMIKDGQYVNELGTYRPSTNSTYVNYIALENGNTIRLNDGDIITVGDTILKFQMSN